MKERWKHLKSTLTEFQKQMMQSFRKQHIHLPSQPSHLSQFRKGFHHSSPGIPSFYSFPSFPWKIRFSQNTEILQMTMQVTSRARRVYKIRGSQAVPSGRPRQDGKVTKQLVITDDNEELFFKLPGPKKRLQKIKHNLMDLVKNGSGADKKHWSTCQKLMKKTRIDYIKD